MTKKSINDLGLPQGLIDKASKVLQETEQKNQQEKPPEKKE
jgi:hypothetical protein